MKSEPFSTWRGRQIPAPVNGARPQARSQVEKVQCDAFAPAIDDLVARISAICPLLPGDLIFTGTPAGVGNRRNPPRYLQPGETLVSRVDGIGQIRQRFR